VSRNESLIILFFLKYNQIKFIFEPTPVLPDVASDFSLLEEFSSHVVLALLISIDEVEAVVRELWRKRT
jgi:hypothetical protein